MVRCPRCGGDRVVKNGRTHNDKQNHKCTACGRQFIEHPTKGPISQETKDLIGRLLLERLSLAAIARVAGVSEAWLQGHVNRLYEAVPTAARGLKKNAGRLTLECDEAWSFVGCKADRQWIWVALDADTRQVVAMHIGSRDEAGARALWDALPAEYRDGATCRTDFWAAYAAVIPADRHEAAGKEAGKTNRVERFNNTMRQRVGRLVRKTLSFSKKLVNHVGAIWLFVHAYNQSLQ